MFRSDVICMIKEGRQMAAVKMPIAYSYNEANPTILAALKIFGLSKTGRNFIGQADLTVGTDAYAAGEIRSCTIFGLTPKEYPYIQWEIFLPTGCKFANIHGDPQIIFSVTGGTDFPDNDNKIQAV